MMIRYAALLLVASFSLWLVGCTKSTPTPAKATKKVQTALTNRVYQVLQGSESFEFLTLNPWGVRSARGRKGTSGEIHGYGILGRKSVSSNVKRAILTSLYSGIDEYEGPGMMCFDPRHAIVASHGDDTVELSICFHCRWVRIYLNGEHFKTIKIAWSPYATFTEIAEDHDLPIPEVW